MKQLPIVLAWSALVIPALPLFLGLGRFKHCSSGQRRLMVLLATILAFGGLATALSLYWGNNLPLWHLYAVVELAMYAWIYATEIRFRWFASGALVVVISHGVFAILNLWWPDGLMAYPSTSLTVKSIVQSALAIIYFVQLFLEMRIWRVEREFGFWLSIGNLVLNLGGLSINLFYRSMQPQADTLTMVWAINSTVSMLTYSIYSVAIVCKKAAPTS